MRSLRRGLELCSAFFNENPDSVEKLGDVVHVVGNVEALKQAISLKKQGRIKNLIAGPNLVVWPSDSGRILTHSLIDKVITPSPITMGAYVENQPSLKNNIAYWFAGIDETYWNPGAKEYKSCKSNTVLVYFKPHQSNLKLCEAVEELLHGYGWQTIRITYGKYNHESFKKALSKSKWAVFLSFSESQGIALAESWAMNVPTLVWNPRPPFSPRFGGKQGLLLAESCSQFSWAEQGLRDKEGLYKVCRSSCPYLESCLGKDWKTLKEFEKLIKNITDILSECNPRAWVLKNMTDKASAERLLYIIQDL